MPLHIAIIGGGAAGFFAAIEAKRNYPDTDITIFEKNQKMLAKVAITGGGRCNLTNSFEQISDPKHAYPRGDKLMKRLFKRFDHHAAYAWFEREGVPLTTQEDECVFPVSQDAMSIVNCLTTLASRLGVKQLGGYQLKDISQNADGTFHLTFAGGKEADFDRVAIATGGAPKGEGLDVFARLDHDIATPVPSLFTFNIADRSFLTLMGTVVEDAIASLPGTKFRAEGPLLVTHWGMSGPAALKLSAHAARYLQEHNYQADVAINWTGESRRNVTEEEIAPSPHATHRSSLPRYARSTCHRACGSTCCRRRRTTPLASGANWARRTSTASWKHSPTTYTASRARAASATSS